MKHLLVGILLLCGVSVSLAKYRYVAVATYFNQGANCTANVNAIEYFKLKACGTDDATDNAVMWSCSKDGKPTKLSYDVTGSCDGSSTKTAIEGCYAQDNWAQTASCEEDLPSSAPEGFYGQAAYEKYDCSNDIVQTNYYPTECVHQGPQFGYSKTYCKDGAVYVSDHCDTETCDTCHDGFPKPTDCEKGIQYVC